MKSMSKSMSKTKQSNFDNVHFAVTNATFESELYFVF